MPIGWDHPDTARYYEAFCRCHRRYTDANQSLISAAALLPGMRVLDVAAGTGRTAEAALAYGVDLTCVEPAHAMRLRGESRVPRARWVETWPEDGDVFDRVLCGAGIWQILPLGETFARAAAALRAGGAFVFDIPSLYLGEADPLGGGRDPYLLELPGKLSAGRLPQAVAAEGLPPTEEIDALLAGTGFTGARWSWRSRFTQPALRDWMKIPPITDALFEGLSADERAALVDAAYAECDPESWRWETWSGWTAWKR